jgi:MoaA/NifB/PqqE/SkfB family radical SAM enzyme/Tfp pilus assembly protein PilF
VNNVQKQTTGKKDLFSAAVGFRDTGNVHQAEKLFLLGIEKYRDNFDFKLELAHTYRVAGDYEEAIGICIRLLDDKRKTRKVTELLASLYLNHGDLKNAGIYYKRLLKIRGGHGEGRFGLGKIAVREGRSEDSVEYFRQAVSAGLKQYELYKHYADVLMDRCEYESALKMYLRARSERKSPEITECIIRAYFCNGDYEKAESELSGLRPSEIADMCFEVAAQVYEYTGGYEKALELYKLKTFPEVSGANIRQIDRVKKKKALRNKPLRDQKLLEKAAHEYSCKLTGNQFDYKKLLEYGRMQRALGKTGEAVECFTKALDSSPFGAKKYFKNFIENEIEMARGALYLKSRPQQLKITLTNRCNLKCQICDYWLKNEKWDLEASVLREVEELMPYLFEISWEGGEVFMHEDFARLYNKAAGYEQIMQHITTNGLLIDKNWADILGRGNLTLVYSIDTVDEFKYGQIRRGGRFKKLLKSIEMIKKHRERSGDYFSMEINCVVMKSNYSELDRIIDFAAQYEFDAVKFSPMERILNEENIFLNMDLRAIETIERAKENLGKMADRAGIRIVDHLPGNKIEQKKISFGKKIKNTPVELLDLLYSSHDFCIYPWKSLYINESRMLRPQCDCLVDSASLKGNSLLDSWNSRLMQKYREELLKESPSLCSGVCIERIRSGKS